MMRKNRFAVTLMLALLMLALTVSTAMALSAESEGDLRNILTGGGSNTALIYADNIEITQQITVKNTPAVTLNLNGHTLTVDDSKFSGENNPVIVIPAGAKLTVQNKQYSNQTYGTTGGTPEIQYVTEDGVEATYTYKETLYSDEKNNHAESTREVGAIGKIVSKNTANNTLLFEVQQGGELVIESGVIEGFQNTVIHSKGTVTINGGALIKNKANHYNGAVITAEAGTVTVNGGYICGNEGHNGGAICVKGNVALNVTGGYISKNSASRYAGAIYVDTGATAVISGGYITGNKVNTNGENVGGGIAAYESPKVEVTGGVIAYNTAKNGGGICLMNETTLTMSGGKITGNSVVSEGGGIYSTGGSDITLTGGEISGNNAHGSGGAINMQHEGSVLTIGAEDSPTGPVIKNNQAFAFGGGVFIDRGARLKMYGGTITHNASVTREGGGLTIYEDEFPSSGVIHGGEITDNYAGATLNEKGEFDPYEEYGNWGGGGIYVAEGTYLAMPGKVLITQNVVGGVGGGMAGCPTGRLFIYGADNAGPAIYGNKAAGVNFSGDVSTKPQDHLYAKDNPVFMANGYQDYFSAFNTSISNRMFQGFAHWSGSVDGVPVNVDGDDDLILESSNVMGLTARQSDDAPTAGDADVLITGNHSYTHAGGILCDGYLLLGDAEQMTVRKPLTLSFDKNVDGVEDLSTVKGMFTFVVEVEEGEVRKVVATGTNDEKGVVNFSDALIFDENSYNKNEGHTVVYYVREQSPVGGSSGITYDPTEYRLTFTVGKAEEEKVVPEDSAAEEFTDITKTRYWIESVTVEKLVNGQWTTLTEGKNGDYQFAKKSEAWHDELHISDAFTNTVDNNFEKVAINGEKVWRDGGDLTRRPKSITVRLLDTNGNTVKTATVYPSVEDGKWHYDFGKMPKYDEEEEEIQYHLSEDPVEGYMAEYAKDNTIITNYIPTTVSVTKVWNDEDNRDGIRPTQITVYIKNGSDTVDTLTLTAGDDGIWQDKELKKTSKELPKYDENDDEIEYTVEEVSVSGYTPEITGSVITNTHIADTVDVTGTKTWNDYNNKYGKRPSSITVNLLANDVKVDSLEVTAAADGSWTYSWPNLKKYENGVEIVYTVTEDPVKGYATEISGNNITNSLIMDMPTTGDDSRLMLYAALLAVSAALGLALRKRSRA